MNKEPVVSGLPNIVEAIRKCGKRVSIAGELPDYLSIPAALIKQVRREATDNRAKEVLISGDGLNVSAFIIAKDGIRIEIPLRQVEF